MSQPSRQWECTDNKGVVSLATMTLRKVSEESNSLQSIWLKFNAREENCENSKQAEHAL